MDNATKDPNFANGMYQQPDDDVDFVCMDFMPMGDKLSTPAEDPKFAHDGGTTPAPGTTVPTEGT